MYIICLDLESIIIPEIWISIAQRTKIKELRLTTRDVPDYDFLMKRRLDILKTHHIKFKDIQRIIKEIRPLPGGLGFLNWLRQRSQVIILSDTYLEFFNPLIKKLNFPTIFCNYLEIDQQGFIKNYQLRQKDGKKESIKSLKSLGYQVVAIGDSYNDVTMLEAADQGILFKPSPSVKKEFPQFLAIQNYQQLKSILRKYL